MALLLPSPLLFLKLPIVFGVADPPLSSETVFFSSSPAFSEKKTTFVLIEDDLYSRNREARKASQA